MRGIRTSHSFCAPGGGPKSDKMASKYYQQS